MKKKYSRVNWKKFLLRSRHIYLFAAVAVMMFASGCGDDGSSTTQEDYDSALFLAYASTNPTEPMHAIIYDNLKDAFEALTSSGLQSYLYTYYEANGELPASVNIITDVKNAGYSIPSGITSGVLTFESEGSLSWNITATVTLSGFTNNSLTYYGDIKASDLIAKLSSSTGELKITSGTLKATSLSIVSASDSYAQADYTSFSVKIIEGDDSDYPTLTIDGTVSVYDESDGETNEIVFSSLNFSQTSTGIESISGTFSIDDSSYTVGGSSISRDSDFYWTDGTLTITAENSDDEDSEDGYVTITVTFDGTTATLSKTSEEWDVEDWCEDRLLP
jgi:hypothetical protein